MNHSMITAMVSMSGLQQRIDGIADNLANANTVGYKRSDAAFEDVLTSVKQQPEAFRQPGRNTPLGFVHGWGSRLAGMRMDMAQASIKETGNPLDTAIEGNGLFEVIVPGTNAAGEPVNQPAWTRNGSFRLSPDGEGSLLINQDGYPVSGMDGRPIRIPAEYEVQIASDGTVTGKRVRDGIEETVPLGRLRMVEVVRPDLLQHAGNGLYSLPGGADPNDGTIVRVWGGAGGMQVRQGALEQSNVDIAVEMTDLLSVQRAYQLSARALSSSDTMMNLANNLRA